FSHDGIIYGYTDTNTIKRFINMQNNSILDTFFNDLYTHTFPSDTSSCYISRHHHMKFITKKALAPNSPQYAASLVASLPDIANFPQVCAVDAYINNNIILLHTKNFPWIHLQNGHWQELRNTDADILPVITKYDPKKDIIIMYDEVHNLISLWNRKNDLYQPFLSLPLAQRRMFGCYFVDATIIPASTRHKIRFFMLLGDPAEYHALTIPDDAIDPKKAILTKIHPDTFDTIHPAQDGVHYWVEEHTSSKEKMLKYCKKGKILQQFYVQKPAKIIAVHAHALAIRQQKENDFETHIFHNHPLVLGDEVKDKYDKDDTGNTVLRTLALS
ncbi:MAG TPA: hypothetical protein VEK38_04005, partial [Candidatus Bathyarchaeia archaeon]|nr:hypothetical protein [Candidatus Bathyarchaeia archaeon]